MSIPALSQRILQHLETIKDLGALFIVTTGAEEYLFTHSGVLSILKEAKTEIQRYFQDSQPILDVAEDDNGNPYKLYVRIPVSYEPEEANDRLNALDENWVLSHIDELSGIIIDVAYV